MTGELSRFLDTAQPLTSTRGMSKWPLVSNFDHSIYWLESCPLVKFGEHHSFPAMNRGSTMKKSTRLAHYSIVLTLLLSVGTSQAFAQNFNTQTQLTEKFQQCAKGSYKNSKGNCVKSPTKAPAWPAGSSAKCWDGTYSYSQSRRGTCSHHGGVATWKWSFTRSPITNLDILGYDRILCVLGEETWRWKSVLDVAGWYWVSPSMKSRRSVTFLGNRLLVYFYEGTVLYSVKTKL